MNIELEKALIIKQFQQINDADLIKAFKSLLEYGIKQQEHISENDVPEWHKNVVRQRLADAKAHPEKLLSWDEVMNELDK